VKSYFKYEKKRLPAWMPNGVVRNVAITYSLKAEYVGHHEGKAKMYRGWVEWDSNKGMYRFFFKRLEEELEYIARHDPKRKTYLDQSAWAVAYRTAHSCDKVKQGELWR
jgi:hypothetical protein